MYVLHCRALVVHHILNDKIYAYCTLSMLTLHSIRRVCLRSTIFNVADELESTGRRSSQHIFS
jgi:hypothetical protein